MAVAPTSIRVLVLPADDSGVHDEILSTVKVDIRPYIGPHAGTLGQLASMRTDVNDRRSSRNFLTFEQLETFERSEADNIKRIDEIEARVAPINKLSNELQNEAARGHMVFHFDEKAFQPAISLLPDIRATGKWDNKEWDQRSVIPVDTDNIYHAFFTRSKGRVSPNPLVQGRLWGDIFLLKVSDFEDQYGRRFYQDVKDDLPLHDVENITSQLSAKLSALRKIWREIGVEGGH